MIGKKQEALLKAKKALQERREKKEIENVLGKGPLVDLHHKKPDIPLLDLVRAKKCASVLRHDYQEDDPKGRKRAILIGKEFYADLCGEAKLVSLVESIPKGEFKFPEGHKLAGEEELYNHCQLLMMTIMGCLVSRKRAYQDNHFLMNLADKSTYNLLVEFCEVYLKIVCDYDEEKGFIMPRTHKKIKSKKLKELVEDETLHDYTAFSIVFDCEENKVPRTIILTSVNCSTTT